MFSPYSPQTEEEYFVNINYSKNIECILPTSDLLINFRLTGMLAKKPCYVYAEKMDFKGLIQLRITEKCDQRRMYITTVDTTSFQALKQDQSLHVTFGGFVENLIKILQDCQAGKLEINLVQVQRRIAGAGELVDTSGGEEFQLQFYEMRTFKNLIHLCLPMRMAPLNVVLFYMNSILDALQKKNAGLELSMQALEHEIRAHARRIEQYELENTKLRENLLENTKALTLRHNEEMQQMQESLKKASEQRHNDNERNRKAINALQLQLDQCAAEKANALAENSQEKKRNDNLNEEIRNLKGHMGTMNEQNEKLQTEISALKNLERKNEMHLNDTRKHIAELQEKLKKHDKIKADLFAELEAEKKITQTKRNALEMTTEEISKANEIIMKQSQELMKLKKTISWRTEVALQQEKAIKEKDLQLELRQHQINSLQKTVESLRLEIPQQLESMRKFATSIESKYAEQIKALKHRLSTSGKENTPIHSTTTGLSTRIRK